MYEGTLYGHWEAIVTLQQMLVLCNQDGVLDMTPQAMAARTSIPLEIITKGIGILSEPDPYTRTPGEEGRRIILMDDRRPWGWLIVNYAKYRDMVNRAQKNEADRIRISDQRNAKKNKDVVECSNLSPEVASVADVAHVTAEASATATTKNKDTPAAGAAPVRVNGSKQKKTQIPEGFGSEFSPAMRGWLEKRGETQVKAHLIHFVGYAKANGKAYADWEQAFQNAIREDWAGIRKAMQ